MKEQVTQARLRIDAITTLASFLQPIVTPTEELKEIGQTTTLSYSRTRELENVLDSLKLGKAWLGKFRGILGDATPYQKDGQRQDVKDIEKTNDNPTDISNLLSERIDQPNWVNLNHVQKVDAIRQEIEYVIKEHVNPMIKDNETRYGEALIEDINTPSGYLELENVITHLSEARFWLGFELQRIREENENNNAGTTTN